jgi:hypothetical protein
MRQATRDLGREAHWQRVLARWKRSGLSVRAFCQAGGVSEPSFYGWRRKFDRGVRPADTVPPRDPPGRSEASRERRSGIFEPGGLASSAWFAARRSPGPS